MKTSRRSRWLPVVVLMAFAVCAAVGLQRLFPQRPAVVPFVQADRQEETLRDAVRAAPEDPRPRVALARYLLDQHRRSDALDIAREAQARFPESVPVREILAEALLELARLPEAVEVLRPLARTNPDFQVRLAAYLVRAGRSSEAVQVLRSLRKPSADLAFRAGQVALDALRPEDALSFFKTAAAARPEVADIQTQLGLTLILLGRYAEAVQPLERAVRLGPGHAAPHAYLGSALRLSHHLDRLPEAAEHLDQAVALEPGAAQYHYELGLVHVQLRSLDLARPALERVVELRPEWAECLRDLVRLCTRQGEPIRAAIMRSRYLRQVGDASQAVRELEPLVRKHPEETTLALELGEAYYDNWQAPATLAVLHRLADRSPKDPQVLEALYRGERAAHRYEASLTGLERLIAVDPNRTDLIEERLDLLQRLGRYTELEQLLVQLRDREPGSAQRHFQLGQVYRQWAQRPDRASLAEASFREAVRLKPDYAEAHHELGLVLLNAGRPADALSELRRAVDVSPRRSETHRLLARAYTAAGDRQRAAEAFRVQRYFRGLEEEENALVAPGSLRRATPVERERLGAFYLRVGRFEGTVKEWEAVLQARPAATPIRRQLARLYGHLRRFQRHYEEAEQLRRDGARPEGKAGA